LSSSKTTEAEEGEGGNDDKQFVESAVSAYISKDIVARPEVLPLKDDSRLLESRILDSLSLLKLVLFLEQRFGVTVETDELVPENFETIERIANFVRSKKKKK
jgi:acyl carrier protein